MFIKYNSASGDAFLSGYAGDSRGVLFTPGLPDAVFRCVSGCAPVAGSPSDPWGPHAHCRQFGYLPLSLMDSR